jgi:NAD+ synthase (glutamine-hydrolysing)
MPDFESIYAHGYVRGAVCVPRVRIADPAYNLERTLGLARQAHDLHAGLALFPELGLSAYSNDDLFHQDALLDGVLAAVAELVEASRSICPVLLVGAPLRFEGKLFNCGLVVHRGRLLGIVPKTYIPNYREFYEKRQFTSGRDAVAREVTILGSRVPFGSDLIFDAEDLRGLSLHVEIC